MLSTKNMNEITHWMDKLNQLETKKKDLISSPKINRNDVITHWMDKLNQLETTSKIN